MIFDMTEISIYITKHAFDMGNERLGLREKQFRKLALRALTNGINHSDTKGTLNKYITRLYFKNGHANNIRIYGHNVFIFEDHKLITVYQIPPDLKKYLKLFKHDEKEGKEQDTEI